MDEIINDLVELASEGIKEVQLVLNLRGRLSIHFAWDKVSSEYVIGNINLEAYNTYEEIKEEIKYMLEA